MKPLWERIIALAGSNFGLKVLALVIAVGLWVAGHRDIERAIEVPVEFRNTPADLMVLDNRIDYVVLRLMGPRTLISTLDPDDLKLSVDLSSAKAGALSYPLGVDSFNVPRGIAVARITPPVIHLRMEPLLRRTLPVSVRVSGKPALGFRVAESTTLPPDVSVSGPAEEIRRLSTVETVPVELDETRDVIKYRVRLSSDGKPLTFQPEIVEVTVKVEEEEATREFSGVLVRAKDFKGSYTVSPSGVSLRLAGAKSKIDKLELTGDNVFINLKGMAVGDHSLTLTTNLPEGIRVVQQNPQRFKVRISKVAE
jgi:YbbR domain-containing protein